MYEILQKAHRHTLKSHRLTVVLPSPPRLAFRNAKTLKDHVVRSKLKITYEKPGVTICGRKNCEICHILHQGDTGPFRRFSTRMLQNARANTIRRAMVCDVYFPFSKIL